MKINSFLLITSIFFFIHLPGHAQTEKGSRLLGGGGFFRSSDGSFSTYINPDLGLFLVDNMAVGASLPLFYRNYDTGSSISLGLTPFVRYYVGEGRTRFFALASMGYNRSWYRYKEDVLGENHSEGYGMGTAGIGLAYFLSSQVGLEAMLSYNGRNYQEGDYDGYFDLAFGFQIYLPSSD